MVNPLTLKLLIAYDGTRYGGWQTQRGPQATAPSIQQTLETTLSRITQQRIQLVGSGRTDAGVHAAGQVAHCRMQCAMTLSRLRHSLNQLLPDDIVVRRIQRAPADFHARFDARRKRYRYHIWNSPVRDPFRRHYVHQVTASLDVRAMRRAARRLVGRHDFRRFQTTGHPVRSTVRTIHRLTLRHAPPLLTLEIDANGFLYHMVRAIAGTLIDIGRGRWQPSVIESLLRRRSDAPAIVTAPARGLTLVHVIY